MSALRAKQENIEQGLKSPTIDAVHALEPKRESAAVRPFKPKHVAKAKNRESLPTQRLESRNTWAKANPNGGMFSIFGGFHQ